MPGIMTRRSKTVPIHPKSWMAGKRNQERRHPRATSSSGLHVRPPERTQQRQTQDQDSHAARTKTAENQRSPIEHDPRRLSKQCRHQGSFPRVRAPLPSSKQCRPRAKLNRSVDRTFRQQSPRRYQAAQRRINKAVGANPRTAIPARRPSRDPPRLWGCQSKNRTPSRGLPPTATLCHRCAADKSPIFCADVAHLRYSEPTA